MLRYVTALILFVGCHSAASAQSWLQSPAPSIAAQQTPETVSGVASIGSANVRLPPGNWTLAARSALTGTSSVGGPISDTVEDKIYFQTEHGHLASIIALRSNVGYNPNGWTVPAACSRRDVYYVNNDGEYISHYDCLSINHILARQLRTTTRSDLWTTAFNRMQEAGSLPRQMIIAQFEYLRSNRGAFVAVSVFVNPELDGFAPARGSWSESPWHARNLDAAHKAYLDKVARWAETYRAAIRAAWN